MQQQKAREQQQQPVLQPPPPHMTTEDLEKELAFLDSLAGTLDDRFKIGPLQIGVDTILGWIPFIGDAVSAGTAVYIVTKAQRLGLTPNRQSKITRNALLEFGIGLIPFVGGAFNSFFKAERRNVNIILEQYGKKPSARASLFRSSTHD